jgi:hypothetical protein
LKGNNMKKLKTESGEQEAVNNVLENIQRVGESPGSPLSPANLFLNQPPEEQNRIWKLMTENEKVLQSPRLSPEGLRADIRPRENSPFQSPGNSPDGGRY